MLIPKRAKHKKQFRGRMRGNETRGTEITFGGYGLKAMASGWLSSKQIEAGRKVLTRYTQKGGRVWIRVFPDKPITDKPPEVRMGGGKGDVSEYVVVIRPGRVIFEMGGLPEIMAKEALQMARYKLPMKTRFVKRS